MTDLRKAAEAVLEAWGWDWSEPRNEALRERMETLRQALAQPEQVLTAKVVVTGIEHEPWCDSVTKLLLSFPPQIPPCNCKPKREWVGLTDEEIEEYKWMGKDVIAVIKEIQATLKEKNGG